MTDAVWTSVPADVEVAAPAEVTDHGRWDVTRSDADDRIEGRALAWTTFVDRRIGAWAPEVDLTGRSEVFREAFEEELARLESDAGRA